MLIAVFVIGSASAVGWLRLRVDSSLEPLLPQNSAARQAVLFLRDSSFSDKIVIWFRLRPGGCPPSYSRPPIRPRSGSIPISSAASSTRPKPPTPWTRASLPSTWPANCSAKTTCAISNPPPPPMPCAAPARMLYATGQAPRLDHAEDHAPRSPGNQHADSRPPHGPDAGNRLSHGIQQRSYASSRRPAIDAPGRDVPAK